MHTNDMAAASESITRTTWKCCSNKKRSNNLYVCVGGCVPACLPVRLLAYHPPDRQTDGPTRTPPRSLPPYITDSLTDCPLTIITTLTHTQCYHFRHK